MKTHNNVYVWSISLTVLVKSIIQLYVITKRSSLCLKDYSNQDEFAKFEVEDDMTKTAAIAFSWQQQDKPQLFDQLKI